MGPNIQNGILTVLPKATVLIWSLSLERICVFFFQHTKAGECLLQSELLAERNLCPHPSHIHSWANTSTMPETKSFKEALKEQQALPHPYPNPFHIYPASQNQRVSASIHSMIHLPTLSSVTADVPCCPGRNETSYPGCSCTFTIWSTAIVSSSPVNQLKAPTWTLNSDLLHTCALTLDSDQPASHAMLI